jgi:hypothetical protein
MIEDLFKVLTNLELLDLVNILSELRLKGTLPEKMDLYLRIKYKLETEYFVKSGALNIIENEVYYEVSKRWSELIKNKEGLK